MLAAKQRLRRAGDFSAAIRAGARAGRGGLVVHLLPNAKNGPARAGFVVPRTVGPAVTRNLVRRRLRHLVRERLIALEPGTDVVVRVLPAAAARSYAELAHDLDNALAGARRKVHRT